MLCSITSLFLPCLTSLPVPWQHHTQPRPEPSAAVEARNAPEPTIPLQAVDVTKAALSKYKPVPPMITRAPQQTKRLDVVQAEIHFGIHYLQDYYGVITENGEPFILFSAIPRVNSKELLLVACSKSIDAPKLEPHERGLLQLKLNNARDRIPEDKWASLKINYNIVKDDWLIVQGSKQINHIDVVQAETEFGISYFREYEGLIIEKNVEPRMLFSARFRKTPQKLHVVACPKLINAPNLSPHERGLFKIQLEAARDRVPKDEWKNHKIEENDWLIFVQEDCSIDEEYKPLDHSHGFEAEG